MTTIYTRNKEGDLIPLNIPAIKGKDGINGVDGVAPNIEVGEVTTIETEQEVTATIEGSKENPIIKFSIPKGIDGENGEEGNITIDDNNISEESVWSPDKITGEIKKSNDKLKEIKSKNEDQDNKLKEVERKNELQDFYINGLFNENSHNRLVIEEEGNEIKLEGSKKGFVEVDKIVGNTLVNRVNEPMRELTLNGYIDKKGFSITTNESVENGLVDVVCEGNTLVNLGYRKKGVRGGIKESGDLILYFYSTTAEVNKTYSLLQPNKTYTVIFINKPDYITRAYLMGLVTNIVNNKAVVHFNNTIPETQYIHFYGNKVGATLDDFQNIDYILLEGDYTNKPVPNRYFEGMQSVGEEIDDSHKIEIISKNGNLISETQKEWTNTSEFVQTVDLSPIIDKHGINEYTLSFDIKANKEGSCQVYAQNGSDTKYLIGTHYIDLTSEYVRHTIRFTPVLKDQNVKRTTLAFYTTYKTGILPIVKNIRLQIGGNSSDFIEHMSNKKEILLNEPLRSLPNGVKDRTVKIDGNWFIERNCAEVTLLEDILTTGRWGDDNHKRYIYIHNVLPGQKLGGYIYTDKIPYTNNYTNSGYFGIRSSSVLVFAFPEEVETIAQKKELVRPYLQNGGLKVVYELAKPIYEPLEIDPELSCYDEMTHISNDSLIPCNMVVKNTGFSCRALTSGTIYTAAHNGGEDVIAKVDIADNMVRLHGKGKKVSDVTVVDGNISKLNYTFKGMKSSFEDKLVTQEMVEKGLEKAENLGKYKVNVKVRNKNLANKLINYRTHGGDKYSTKVVKAENGDMQGYLVEIKPNTHYIFTKDRADTRFRAFFFANNPIENPDEISINGGYSDNYDHFDLVSPPNARYCFLYATYNYTTSPFKWCQMEEGVVRTPYEPSKEYNTSIYLNSPLLKGDEIVMKEDGLYHFHKMGKEVLDGSRNWTKADKSITATHTKTSVFLLEVTGSNTGSICDKFINNTNMTSDTEFYYYNTSFFGGSKLAISINNSKLSTQDEKGFKKWLQDNHTTVIYQLENPFYEKISDNTILLDVPNNATLQLDSVLPCQNVKLNYTGKIPNLSVMKNNISIIEERNINTIANNFDMDFRLIELEQALKESKLNLTNARKSNNISSNRFQQAKILILANRYNKEKMTYQLSKYLERGYLNQEEFDELINLMK